MTGSAFSRLNSAWESDERPFALPRCGDHPGWDSSRGGPPEASMVKKLFIVACALVVIGAVAAGALYYAYPVQVSIFGALTRNYLITWFAPSGTATTESNAAYRDAGIVARSAPAEAQAASATAGDWPSYNKTLTSERYSQLSEINTKNAAQLKVLCTYDIGQFTAFESGLIMVDNALIGTTEFDIFSINPARCAENWRSHEENSAQSYTGQPGRGLLGRLAVSRHPGRAGAGLRLQDRQANLGNDNRGRETRRVGAVGADRLGRPRLRRQRGRRLQGRKGAHVRARREDGQDCLGILSGSQNRGRRDPRTAGRAAAQHVDLAKRARHTHQQRRDLDVICPRHENRASLCPGRQSGARLCNRRARGRKSLYRLGRRARRQDRGLQVPFQACAEGLARLGRLKPAHPDSNDGRKAAHGGR